MKDELILAGYVLGLIAVVALFGATLIWITIETNNFMRTLWPN